MTGVGDGLKEVRAGLMKVRGALFDMQGEFGWLKGDFVEGWVEASHKQGIFWSGLGEG